MRSPLAILCGALALALSACATAGRPAAEAALAETCARFEAAVDRGDAAAVAGFFLPDGDRVNATGAWMHGREEIERSYAGMFERRKADASTTPFRPERTIRFVENDVAIVDGRWNGVRGGRPVAGHYTLVALRRGGEWRFAAGRGWDWPEESK